MPAAPLAETVPLTVTAIVRWDPLAVAGIDAVMAALPVLVTLAPAATVKGEAEVVIVTPLDTVPEQVTGVLVWVGLGLHWARA